MTLQEEFSFKSQGSPICHNLASVTFRMRSKSYRGRLLKEQKEAASNTRYRHSKQQEECKSVLKIFKKKLLKIVKPLSYIALKTSCITQRLYKLIIIIEKPFTNI